MEDLEGQSSTVPVVAAQVLPIEIEQQLDGVQQKVYPAALLANGITLSNYQAITDRSLADGKQDLAILMELGLLSSVARVNPSCLYLCCI